MLPARPASARAGGTEPVLTTELSRAEVASAFASAARDRRVAAGPALTATFEADCAPGGPILLIAFLTRDRRQADAAMALSFRDPDDAAFRSAMADVDG